MPLSISEQSKSYIHTMHNELAQYNMTSQSISTSARLSSSTSMAKIIQNAEKMFFNLNADYEAKRTDLDQDTKDRLTWLNLEIVKYEENSPESKLFTDLKKIIDLFANIGTQNEQSDDESGGINEKSDSEEESSDSFVEKRDSSPFIADERNNTDWKKSSFNNLSGSILQQAERNLNALAPCQIPTPTTNNLPLAEAPQQEVHIPLTKDSTPEEITAALGASIAIYCQQNLEMNLIIPFADQKRYNDYRDSYNIICRVEIKDPVATLHFEKNRKLLAQVIVKQGEPVQIAEEHKYLLVDFIDALTQINLNKESQKAYLDTFLKNKNISTDTIKNVVSMFLGKGKYCNCLADFGKSLTVACVTAESRTFRFWSRNVPSPKDPSQSAFVQSFVQTQDSPNQAAQVHEEPKETSWIALNIQTREKNNAQSSDEKVGLKISQDGELMTIYVNDKFASVEDLSQNSHPVLNALKKVLDEIQT